MPQPTIKICGITRLEDAETAAEAAANYIGLIRAESPRAVELETARAIAQHVRSRITPALLFKDASVDVVFDELNEAAVEVAQLHGAEPPEFAAQLLLRLPALRIIRAFPVIDGYGVDIAAWLDAATPFAQSIIAVILDAPKGAAAIDEDNFRAVAALVRRRGFKVWRAGGLDAKNVADIADTAFYDGYDVARGVESAPGVKSPDLIRDFVRSARSR